jgi:mycothiol synthase
MVQTPALLYPYGMLLDNPGPQIGGISIHDRAKALELVFSYLPPHDRRRQITESLRRGGPCEGLIATHRDGRMVGAMFSQIEPGKTAIVWLPRLVPGEPESTAARLFAAMLESLAHQQLVLAQILLPTVSRVEEARLQRGGFHHLANLLYLVSPVDCHDSIIEPRPVVAPRYATDGATTSRGFMSAATRDLEFEPYCADNHHRLARVIVATYRETLDCPALNGVRTAEDVLAGYRVTGEFAPRHWLIIRHARRDIGCLLLADHPRHDNMELLYLGLIPAARGHGWGKRLVRYAQRLARQAGRCRVVLAVDAANAPAVQTYTATDFQTWQRRRLYVRQLVSGGDWHTSFRQVFHDEGRRGDKDFCVVRATS